MIEARVRGARLIISVENQQRKQKDKSERLVCFCFVLIKKRILNNSPQKRYFSLLAPLSQLKRYLSLKSHCSPPLIDGKFSVIVIQVIDNSFSVPKFYK